MNESDLRKDFTPSGFFLLRTPLLAFDELLGWAEGLEAPDASGDPARFRQAVAGDRLQLRARLREMVARPEVREALYIASPDLDESIEAWERDAESKRGQRVERALVRYLMRMAGRATPFGLFAGCSLGEVGPRTDLIIEGLARYGRHTRLDMDYLCALVHALEQNPSLRRTLVYRPNSSLYQAAGRVRYVESRTSEDVRSYHLVAVAAADYLDAALSLAEGGARPPELAASLSDTDLDFSPEEAEEFVGELIENQLLISDLQPAITGPEPINELIVECRARAESSWVAERLEQACDALAALDAGGIGNVPDKYKETARLLEDLPAPVNPQRLFQVDMTKAARATLGHGVVREIIRGVETLHRLAPPAGPDPLTGFRERFVERYGEGREVPLLHALDADVGIGFGESGAGVSDNSPLLEGLAFPAASGAARSWGERETRLLRKLEGALERGEDEITLAVGDIEELGSRDRPPLPNAFAVVVSVAAVSEAALARGDFSITVGEMHGPSGVRLLGRFCHSDAALLPLVEAHLRAEEALAPEAVYAEVVHLPAGRTGNILLRPLLRDFEIPYLGRSGAHGTRQLKASDLLVTVMRGRVLLRSKRLGREVVPRLTAAHYYLSGGLDVYRFLCLQQKQGVAPDIDWSWGALSEASFLPRVRFGRVVLSRARWNVGKAELQTLSAGGPDERFRATQSWRERRRVPRFVALAEEDNELPVDLDNALSVDTFLELAKASDGVGLVEVFPKPDELLARGPEGRFVHQLIVPFVRTHRPTRGAGNAAAAEAGGDVTRVFPPGSEWLYAKLYAGSSSADQLLRDLVAPVVRQALGSGAADSWFFIRYGDPEWHVRLRVHGPPHRLHAEVMPMLNAAAAPFMSSGLLWRVQFDTYEREVERYGGGDAIVLAEGIFRADSEAVLSIVEAFEGNAGLEARWRLALRGIDALMSDCGLDLPARHSLTQGMLEGFGGEMEPDLNLRRQLGQRYRRERRMIAELLEAGPEEGGVLSPGLAAITRRSESIVPLVAELRERARASFSGTTPTSLLPSLIHMHVNRILRSAQRAQEFILYDLLARHYEALEARLRVRKH